MFLDRCVGPTGFLHVFFPNQPQVTYIRLLKSRQVGHIHLQPLGEGWESCQMLDVFFFFFWGGGDGGFHRSTMVS